MPPATAHKKGQYLGQTVILTQGSVCVRQVIKHTFSFSMIFLLSLFTIMSTICGFAVMAVFNDSQAISYWEKKQRQPPPPLARELHSAKTYDENRIVHS